MQGVRYASIRAWLGIEICFLKIIKYRNTLGSRYLGIRTSSDNELFKAGMSNWRPACLFCAARIGILVMPTIQLMTLLYIFCFLNFNKRLNLNSKNVIV